MRSEHNGKIFTFAVSDELKWHSHYYVITNELKRDEASCYNCYNLDQNIKFYPKNAVN